MREILTRDKLDYYYDVIHKNHFFSGIKKDEMLDVLEASNSYIQSFDRKQVIYHLGDEIRFAGIVLEGEVKSVFFDEQQNESSIAHFFPGNIFCVASNLLENYESNVEILSLKLSKVLFLDLVALVNSLHLNEIFHPTFQNRITKNIITCLTLYVSHLEMKLLIVGQRHLKDKLKLFFTHSENDNHFKLPTRVSDIATFINVNRTHLHRNIKDLVDEGYIVKHKNKYKLGKNKIN